MKVGEEGEYIPIATLSPPECIKMGSDESHFNVSLTVRDKVTRQCPQTTTFLKRKESRSGSEPRSFRLPAYRLTARPNRFSRSVSLLSNGDEAPSESYSRPEVPRCCRGGVLHVRLCGGSCPAGPGMEKGPESPARGSKALALNLQDPA